MAERPCGCKPVSAQKAAATHDLLDAITHFKLVRLILPTRFGKPVHGSIPEMAVRLDHWGCGLDAWAWLSNSARHKMGLILRLPTRHRIRDIALRRGRWHSRNK
jgi:hypothetical protein